MLESFYMVMKKAVFNRTETNFVRLTVHELESKLRVLDSLGCTEDEYGDFWTSPVGQCLQGVTLIVWMRESSAEDIGKIPL